jgi:hypothetical protein
MTLAHIGGLPVEEALAALPAAGAAHRGKMARVEGGDGVPDRLFICEKDAAGNYVWRPL